MRRGDLCWNEGKAIPIGKSHKQAVIHFSTRSLEALREYLAERAALDSTSRKPLGSLPLFLRHDPGAKKGGATGGASLFKPITTETGRDIVQARMVEALGPAAAGTITPYSFQCYSENCVLRVQSS